MNERRDLQGLTVMTDTGHEARVPKGGLPRLDGMMSVRFEYRDRSATIVSDGDADEATVSAAIKLRAEMMDEQADWDEFAGSLVGEVV